MNEEKRENIDEIIKERKKKMEENIKIPIRGHIEFGNPNTILFSKKNINDNGIRMVMDLLEEITGVHYDASLNWRFPGEKGILSSLQDYLMEILEKKFGQEREKEVYILRENDILELVKSFFPLFSTYCGNCGHDECPTGLKTSCGGWIPVNFQKNIKKFLKK